MRTIALTIVALLLAVGVQAQDAGEAGLWRDVDVQQLSAEIPGAEEYPDADAIFAAVQEIISVDENGSRSIDRNLLIRILTLMGREEYSNQTFLYNSDQSELSVVKGRTVRASGRSKDVDADAVNDVTPAFLAGATVYANVLEKVVSFPVAGAGSTLELQLHESRSPSDDGSFSGIEFMGGSDPFMYHEVLLEAPADREVRTYTTTGAHSDLKMSEERGEGVFRWSMRDIPPIAPEPNMPPMNELLPMVVYSSYEDWNDPATAFAGTFFPHVQTGGTVSERVAELTEGSTSRDDSVRAIFLDVATGIRNVHLSLGVGGYEPNDAETVLSNRYGDTRDKAVLLISMLRAADIEAYPAMVKATLGRFIEEVPTLLQFNRMLVALPSGDGYTFLDPFLDDVVYGYRRWGRGNTALVVTDEGTGELVSVPRFKPAENESRRILIAELAEDGSANVEAACDLVGYFDRTARRALKDATPAEEKQLFERSAYKISPGSTYVSHEQSDLSELIEPARVAVAIDSPDFAVRQGNMMIVRVPEFPFGFADFGHEPTMSERESPYDLPCESRVEYSATVLVPDGYEVVRMPETVSFTTPDATFTLDCSWSEEDEAIRWSRVVEVTQKRIPPERYGDFKSGHDAMSSPKNGLILLRKRAS